MHSGQILVSPGNLHEPDSWCDQASAAPIEVAGHVLLARMVHAGCTAYSKNGSKVRHCHFCRALLDRPDPHDEDCPWLAADNHLKSIGFYSLPG